MAEATVAGVEQAVEALRQAMMKADRDAIAKLTEEKSLQGHTSGRTENQQEFIDGNGKAGFSDIKISNQTVTLIDNLAIVHHDLFGARRTPRPGNETSSMKVMAVWRFKDGQWKLVARQSVKN